MQKKIEKKMPITYYDIIKHFIARDKGMKTKIVEYFGTSNRYGKGTIGGGYYQTKSNPFKKLSVDEIKLRKGVASYYFWGTKIAKWDGKTLWLDTGGKESIELIRRLNAIYISVFKGAPNCATKYTVVAKPVDYSLHSGGINKFIAFQLEGYALGKSAHILNSYPITLCGKTKEILDFTEEQKDMYVSKLLKSRGPRGIFILNTIKSFGFKLTDKDKVDIKAKQLKIFMDDKIDKEFLAGLGDLPDFV